MGLAGRSSHSVLQAVEVTVCHSLDWCDVEGVAGERATSRGGFVSVISKGDSNASHPQRPYNCRVRP